MLEFFLFGTFLDCVLLEDDVKSDFKNFCASYFNMYCNEAVSKSKRPIQFIIPKAQKTSILGLVLEDTNFWQF